MSSLSDVYVLYHAECFDGMGAAWVAKEAIPHATLLPVQYGTPMPSIPQGAMVLLVDFSYKRKDLEALRCLSSSLVIIDHHKTAKDDLEGFPNAIFDMNHSGAILTWKWFHPAEKPPALLTYIEDRDLWRFTLPFSQEVHAWLSSFPKTLDEFTRLVHTFTTTNVWCSNEVAEGSAILRYTAVKTAEMCDQVILQDIAGYRDIPHVNCPYLFGSDVANTLLQRFPSAPFAVYWFKAGNGQYKYGLRSRKDFDCSEVARKFGGGGHPQASGFEGDGLYG